MRYYRPPIIGSLFRTDRSSNEWGILKRMMLFGVPLFAAILTCFALTAYKVGANYLNRAYARNSLTRAKAQAHVIDQRLQDARSELIFMTRGEITPEYLARHIENLTQAQGLRYREIVFQGSTGNDRFALINTGHGVVSIPPEAALAARNGPFSRQPVAANDSPDQVHISQPVEIIYPSVPLKGTMQTLPLHVIRLTTPVFNDDGSLRGYLLLSMDVLTLRNVLSLHASARSPLRIPEQESERAKSFMFDTGGWILFQSESPDLPEAELSTDVVRSGLDGDFGRSGLDMAFRPSPENENYWAMVTEIQADRVGQVTLGSRFSDSSSINRSMFVSYVPVTFRGGPGMQPIIYAGIAYMDTSFMAAASTYKLVGALSVILGIGVLLTCALLLYMGLRLSRPLHQLARDIEAKVNEGDASPLPQGSLPEEAHALRNTVNDLLARLRDSQRKVQHQDIESRNAHQRMPVCLDSEIAANTLQITDPDRDRMTAIVGDSPSVRALRSLIRKASSIAADVLIIGETGTGKELTAEAIHKTSSRANGPFITINCGALDENLLLDALFGHVKGAFSEAKGERKGAFLAADGGTLHLDEIGNASPKVQQALLRALSVRRIRPLGSDNELSFDARIIAATNVDLLECAKAGTFREDLYYRLAVITIETPPLRERREDIPALANYFLKEAAASLDRPPLALSRGALDALIQYAWPGNVREIRNLITRTAAFTEHEIIYAEDLRFRDVAVGPSCPLPRPTVATNGKKGEPQRSTLDGAVEDEAASTKHNAPAQGVAAATGKAQDSSKRSGARTDGAEGAAPGESRVRSGAERVERSMHDSVTGAERVLRDFEPDFDLNPRQRAVWPSIIGTGSTTRSTYQELLGADVSVRTAQYDLQDFVKKGLLVKIGKGPASRYVLAASVSRH